VLGSEHEVGREESCMTIVEAMAAQLVVNAMMKNCRICRVCP